MANQPAGAAAVSVRDYLSDAHVRRRIVEYCGGSPTEAPTAAYVAVLDRTGSGVPSWDRVIRFSTDQLDAALAREGDVARSLWDAEHLLFFLDVDYQNIDAAGTPFLRPWDVLRKLEPTYLAARAVFDRLQIEVAAFVTGRGYHFMGQIRLDDPLVDALADLVPEAPSWYAGVEGRRPAGVIAPLSRRHARAADGLGRLTEYAAHLVLEEARGHGGGPPVVFNGTVVGQTGPSGRECVSIDFSHVGDPLDIRHARAGFSTYQWHRVRPDIFGARAAARAPLASLPRGRGATLAAVAGGRDLAAGLVAAQGGSARLPEAGRGIDRLLAAYARSPLAEFHREFYRDLAAGAVRPLDRSTLPPCVAASFARPNDLLLKPEHIQHAVRWLMSRGWTPAAIARLLQSVYESDHGWGDRWSARMQPRARAEFDVRVFAGLIRTGHDRLVDFNCVSAQEKDLCPRVACRYDLRVDRDALLHSV